MRFGLRGRVLLVTVLTPLTLALATLAVVQRDVREHVNASSIHESLALSQAVFEGILTARSRAMSGGAQVVVADPRFFSLLMLEGSQRDLRFQATMRGMAHDFNRITETDLFEVFDRRGRLLASVGDARSQAGARDSLVRLALRGRTPESVLVLGDEHFQVALAPVRADGRVVGVLLLGAKIGNSLARLLRAEMRCEVTFVSEGTLTGTTLPTPGDRAALRATLASLDLGPGTRLERLGVLRVRGPSGTQLTIVRRIPLADPRLGQYYVLQRSFDPETMFQRRMESHLVGLAVLALCAALLAGWLFSGHIIRPLRALVRAAHAMEAGDYQHPLDVSRRDEVGYLATRFVEMRRRERGYVEALEQVARVKSEFIQLASQELRSPISGIVGYHDLLACEMLGPLTERQRQALGAMEQFLARLTRVADEATHAGDVHSERFQLDRQDHEVGRLLRLAVGEAHAACVGRDIRLQIPEADERRIAHVDRDLLQRALAQLIQHTAGEAADGVPVLVEVRLAAGVLHVGVHDGDAPPTGGAEGAASAATLGLGVSVARSVLEAHGGSLRVMPASGRATAFAAELPLDAGPARAAA